MPNRLPDQSAGAAVSGRSGDATTTAVPAVPAPMDHELGAAHIAAADRRIAEAEVRLMRMEELLAEMERDGHAWGLAEGRGVIATCERSLGEQRAYPAFKAASRDA